MHYLELTEEPNRLRIELLPEGREEIAAWRARGRNPHDEALLRELLEYQLCNGWTWVRPEQIGALTDAPILSPDAEYREEDDGLDIAQGGSVYWYPNYAIRSPLADLEEDGVAYFPKAPEA